jgi:hypothetical protein
VLVKVRVTVGVERETVVVEGFVVVEVVVGGVVIVTVVVEGLVVVQVVVVVVAASQFIIRLPVPPTCNVVLGLFCETTKRPPVVDQEENW